MGTKLVFIVRFYLKCVSDNGLKEALKIKSLDSVKVLNLRRLEHEFSYSMWFDFIAMRFVADTADFPAICHVSDAKDITRNRRETSLRHEQFGKGIVKYNAFKQNFTLFCSTSEPKGVSFTLWIFRWRIFDRRNVLYALGNDKVADHQLPEAANVLYWFEKVPYLLCWKLGRTLGRVERWSLDFQRHLWKFVTVSKPGDKQVWIPLHLDTQVLVSLQC